MTLLKNLHLGLKGSSLDEIDIFDQYILEILCHNMLRIILNIRENSLMCKLTHLNKNDIILC